MTASVTHWIVSLTLWLFRYKISSCTTCRDLPSNVWWLYQWQTELSPLPCDFLHIKFLLVLHLEACQAMSDDCLLYRTATQDVLYWALRKESVYIRNTAQNVYKIGLVVLSTCYVVFFVLFLFVLCFVLPLLPVSLDCLFLIAPSVLSDVYLNIQII
jgi:hypothetical protein